MARAGFVTRLLRLFAVVASLALVAACGGSAMGVDLHACDTPPAPGVWNVSLDYGEGKTGMQRWTISRDYCTLDIVADPRDEYTPDWALIEPGTGFWGTPINTVGPCDYYLDMTVTVTGNSFQGSIAWQRRANRTGECAPADGRILVTAIRS